MMDIINDAKKYYTMAKEKYQQLDPDTQKKVNYALVPVVLGGGFAAYKMFSNKEEEKKSQQQERQDSYQDELESINPPGDYEYTETESFSVKESYKRGE